MKNSYSKILSIALVLLASTSIVTQAQKNYNQTDPFLNANAFWAWHDNNGLDFSGGTPVHVPTAFDIPQANYFAEGVSSVSDPNTGDLLFYTNGRKVWDKNHNLMPNGDSLYGNWRGTVQQGSRIVPVVGEEGKYYVFSLGCLISAWDATDSAYAGLYYSIVDVTLNGGDGDVVSNAKNIPIDTVTSFTEAMIAIPGNNCNVWLLTHGGGFNPEYLAFEITSSGINTSPVISPGLFPKMGIGHLSVSPDRSKVCMSELFASIMGQIVGGLQLHSEVLEFDPNSGNLSNGIAVNTSPANEWYGVYTTAFSPNSNRLYLGALHQSSGNFHTAIMQFDLSVYDSSAINSSYEFIDTILIGHGNMSHPFTMSLKLYNDSIYLLYANRNFLGRINQPNLLGASCDFVEQAIQLPYPYRTNIHDAAALNEVVYATSYSQATVLDSTVCGEFVLRPAQPNPNASYAWSDGSKDSILHVSAVGTYWVTYAYLEDNCVHQRVDTFKVLPGTVNPPAEITINVDTLGTTVSYASYQWMLNGNLINGATESTYTALENGRYQVIVSNEYGCVDTSGVYEVTNKETGISRSADQVVINIYPNPAHDIVFIDSKEDLNFSLFSADGREVQRNIPGKKVDLSGLPQGLYLLKLFDKSGQLVYLSKVTKLN